MRDFKIIGHRGACSHEPENTLRSIHRAIADGADMIEIDVRYAAGEIFVIHDLTLNRTTNGHGPIHSLSYPEIRTLDAGQGEKIPTLSEVLEATLGTCPLNIELKEIEASKPVCNLLKSLNLTHSPEILISSLIPDALHTTRRHLPHIPIGIVDDSLILKPTALFRLASELNATSIHPNIRHITPSLVTTAHAKNLLVLPFTIRTEKQLQKALSSGANGCFADDPKWARHVMNQSQS